MLAASRSGADIAALGEQVGDHIEIDFGKGDFVRLSDVSNATGLDARVHIF